MSYKTSPPWMSYKFVKFSMLFAKNLPLCQFPPSVELSLHVHNLLAGHPAEFGQNIHFWLAALLNSESSTFWNPSLSWPTQLTSSPTADMCLIHSCVFCTSWTLCPWLLSTGCLFPSSHLFSSSSSSACWPQLPRAHHTLWISLPKLAGGDWTLDRPFKHLPPILETSFFFSALLWGQHHMDLAMSHLSWNWH